MYPVRLRAATALAPMSSSAVRSARGLSSGRSSEAPIDIEGRRSQSATTRGASSAKRSRTMNSSVPRAADRRADAAQSIHPTSSPGRYSRVLATSEPTPRRALRTPPKASPITRRRGTSGKTVAKLRARRRRDVEVDVEARLRRDLEAPRPHLEARGLPAAVSELGEEARPEEDPVHEHRNEQLLHVFGRHVAARVQHRPRTGGAIERERPAHRAADRHEIEVSRGAYELDDPVPNGLVHEHACHRAVEDGDLVEADHRLEGSERMAARLLVDASSIVAGARVTR